MKVLIDNHMPFQLAHGGAQIQIERTKRALEEIGVCVEWLRWWDASQSGDVIHFFGRPDASHIRFAHAKGMRYVMMELLTGQGSRSLRQLRFQRHTIKLLKMLLPETFQASFRWKSYSEVDALLFSTEWEAKVGRMLFDAPPEKTHILPNGVDDVFYLSETEMALRQERLADAKWLICLATITERKRVLELAETAVSAGTPIWFIGKSYGGQDDYGRRFIDVVKNSNGIVRASGEIADTQELAGVLKKSRGFVLLSTMETQSVAALAAAAAGCPLLLSDLPWARATFANDAWYCPIGGSREEEVSILRKFYDSVADAPCPVAPPRWAEIAVRLLDIYQSAGVRGETANISAAR